MCKLNVMKNNRGQVGSRCIPMSESPSERYHIAKTLFVGQILIEGNQPTKCRLVELESQRERETEGETEGRESTETVRERERQ